MKKKLRYDQLKKLMNDSKSFVGFRQTNGPYRMFYVRYGRIFIMFVFLYFLMNLLHFKAK